jgi:hypothetical protein
MSPTHLYNQIFHLFEAVYRKYFTYAIQMACFAFSIVVIGGLLLKIWGQKNETWFLFLRQGGWAIFLFWIWAGVAGTMRFGYFGITIQ